MKTIFSLFCVTFLTITSFAQNYDIILKTNGEEMEGHVNSIDDRTIDFNYKNETLHYKVDKIDIAKITFASGRVEFFNAKNSDGNKADLENHHNKVAILPFAYIKDERDGSKSVSNRIQEETYSLFKNHNADLEYQDPKTTNALLIKAGVTNNNIAGYTMGEICHILNVEYVIQGTVSVQKTSKNTYGGTASTTKNSGNAHVDKNGHLIGDIYGSGKSKTYQAHTSSTIQNYGTSMVMNIYNDRGDNLFSQEHESFWNTEDAYKITLKYLAKRTPFYKK